MYIGAARISNGHWKTCGGRGESHPARASNPDPDQWPDQGCFGYLTRAGLADMEYLAWPGF